MIVALGPLLDVASQSVSSAITSAYVNTALADYVNPVKIQYLEIPTMTKTKKNRNKLFLAAPEGVNVKIHIVGNQTRYTVPTAFGYEKLVAIAEGQRFLWVCSGFSA